VQPSLDAHSFALDNLYLLVLLISDVIKEILFGANLLMKRRFVKIKLYIVSNTIQEFRACVRIVPVAFGVVVWFFDVPLGWVWFKLHPFVLS